MSIESDTQAFMKATKGVNAWTVARALNKLTPGIDWRKCSRSYMANEWAKAQDGSMYSYEGLSRITLDQLVEKIGTLYTYGRR